MLVVPWVTLRMAATSAESGSHSPITRGTVFIPEIGTKVPARNDNGKTMAKPIPWTASELLMTMPIKTPNQLKAVRPSKMSRTSSTTPQALMCGRQPSARPTTDTMTIPRICSRIWPTTCEVITARRVTGSERKRSSTPLPKSVAVATPAPMMPKARLWPISPGNR